MATTTTTITATTEDPYIWLEDVEAKECLDFAKSANDKCLEALGDPKTSNTKTFDRVLEVLESKDRIPYTANYGKDESGERILFNFWKDEEHPKGIWRKTTMESYQSQEPQWTTVLDVDDLAEKDGISWVWKGTRGLPRKLDPMSDNGRMVTRTLLSLSRGGSDAIHLKEFDLLIGDFVTDQPFNLPEAKTRASYKSRNVLLVGSDFGPDSLTDSGYPRTVREWVRGTDVNDAPVIFEGEKTDVAVSSSLIDEREWGGGLWHMNSRSLTFYTSKYWIAKLQAEHLLAPFERPEGLELKDPVYVELDVQEDANVETHAALLLITLRSDWTPKEGATTYKRGSVIYCQLETFLEQGKAGTDFEVLFEPTERTAYEYHTCTKNYLILSTMDNVKSKLEFFKLANGGTTLTLVGADREALIRSASASPIDGTDNDEFWFTTSDYVTPETLCLADASRVESEEEKSAQVYVTKQVKSLPAQYDTSGLKVEQRVAISKDGTEIPYFIVMKEDIELNGKNPVLLYGYGGFEISLSPHYIATSGLAWLERGGVYVEANIRGGGEFGPSWHQAALKENRNKAHEDFIAVGEHLIASKICTPKTLAARGGSNGASSQ
jgi:prolyl oligopeptidase